jgi:hypothetical protein
VLCDPFSLCRGFAESEIFVAHAIFGVISWLRIINFCNIVGNTISQFSESTYLLLSNLIKLASFEVSLMTLLLQITFHNF